MDPRISFSNDFVDTQYPANNYREAPVSADFEFSIKNYAMIPADEIFFKGILVPLKENCRGSQMGKITLRDELLVGDDESGESGRSSGWWKGLKRGHSTAKKVDRNVHHGVLERVMEEKVNVFVHDEGITGCKRIREVLSADH